MVGEFCKTITYTVVIMSLLVAGTLIGTAQVMQSTNYQMQSDSLNFGGGFSSSTNFQQESSLGEIATGRSTSTNFQLRAGYQQMQSVFIALSTTGAVVMDTALGGISAGESNGSSTVTVITDSSGGYQLSIEASNDPALQSTSTADTIADYTPVGAVPDVSFITNTNDVHFAFSVAGDDVVERYEVNGGLCGNGAGVSSALTCWDGLDTADQLIASGAANVPDGATTTVFFKVGIGGGTLVAPGGYVATTTVTAVAL